MLRLEATETPEVLVATGGAALGSLVVRYRDFCLRRSRGAQPVTLCIRDEGGVPAGYLVGLDVDGRLDALPDRVYGLLRPKDAPVLHLDQLHSALRFMAGGSFRVNLAPAGPTELAVSKNHVLDRFRSHESFVFTAETEEAVWDSMPKDGRLAIRRAERDGISISQSTDGGALMRYLGLHVARSARLGGPGMTRQELDLLRDVFGLQMRLVVAAKDRTPVAGMLFVIEGPYALVLDMAAVPQHWQGPAQSLVAWEALRAAIESDVRTFDCGFALTEDTGTRRFWEQLGARRVPLYGVTSG